jgi:hypothetical protein
MAPVANEEVPAHDQVRRVLEPDEQLQITARAVDAVFAVTDRRLAVVNDQKVLIDTPFNGLRRIQFDIERDRAATLVVVPESFLQVPQVLAIPPEEFDAVTQALAIVGRRLLQD